ncbi:MAG: hypothetical protein JST04_00965 [Bdellovibrionales bacterium]|nr:hypothetical protein [Bdellovibrionales bacterium]
MERFKNPTFTDIKGKKFHLYAEQGKDNVVCAVLSLNTAYGSLFDGKSGTNLYLDEEDTLKVLIFLHSLYPNNKKLGYLKKVR